MWWWWYSGGGGGGGGGGVVVVVVGGGRDKGGDWTANPPSLVQTANLYRQVGTTIRSLLLPVMNMCICLGPPPSG